ncbi:hypothetical protein CRM22_008446 [Opisthorchis felineus]|uniref:Uncharacterized protein n=1 Tax=Opisthorchis felineus TaxID=147828 RepID=A0A4V3SDF9_OPIFE|nr:hypothetical protein CRM22_008446 [Opisthorchis felineus]
MHSRLAFLLPCAQRDSRVARRFQTILFIYWVVNLLIEETNQVSLVLGSDRFSALLVRVSSRSNPETPQLEVFFLYERCAACPPLVQHLSAIPFFFFPCGFGGLCISFF